MINPTDPPTNQQIHRFKPTDQPNPAHRSKPSSPIHADPTSKIQNPAPVRDRERKWESEWERERIKHCFWFYNYAKCNSTVELHCSSIAKKFAILEFRILWCSDIWGCKCQILLTFGTSIPQCCYIRLRLRTLISLSYKLVFAGCCCHRRLHSMG